MTGLIILLALVGQGPTLKVTDANGTPLAGADVCVYPNSVQKKLGRTNKSGLIALPATGTYRVEVTRSGFLDYWEDSFVVNGNVTVQLVFLNNEHSFVYCAQKVKYTTYQKHRYTVRRRTYEEVRPVVRYETRHYLYPVDESGSLLAKSKIQISEKQAYSALGQSSVAVAPCRSIAESSAAPAARPGPGSN